MSLPQIFETGFEALGKPVPYTDALIDDIVSTDGFKGVYTENQGVSIRYKGEPVHYRVDTSNVHSEFSVITPDGTFRHYDEAVRENVAARLTHAVLAEIAPDVYKIGRSFSRPFRSSTIGLGSSMTHLFRTTENNQQSEWDTTIAYDVLNPKPNTADTQTILLHTAYSNVPTMIGAKLAAALTVNHEVTAGSESNNFKYWESILSLDSALRIAAEHQAEDDNLAQRVMLTRYLLHQLMPDATMRNNPVAIEVAASSLEQGIMPVSVTEAHLSIEKHVASALALGQTAKKYL